MARAFERLTNAGDALLLTDECGGEDVERIGARLLRPQVQRERLQAFLTGDGRLGAALGLVGQVEIFEFAFVERGLDAGFQLIGQLALLGDGGENRFAARRQIAEVTQFLFDVADLDLVQVAGGFLAIARNEGNGAALVEQFDYGYEAAHRHVQNLRDVDQDFGCE